MDDSYQGNTEMRPTGTLRNTAVGAVVAALVGFGACLLLFILGDWSILQSIFGGAVVFLVLAILLPRTIMRPLPAPVSRVGAQGPTADVARANRAGTPGEPPAPPAPRDLSAPSPHRTEIETSTLSDTRGRAVDDPTTDKAISPGPGGTPQAEAAPATRIPSPAPINAADIGVARPVGATANPEPMTHPTPLHGQVVSPEPPAGSHQEIDRNQAAMGNVPTTRPAPTATKAAQSYNEVDPAGAANADPGAAPAPAGSPARSAGPRGDDESISAKAAAVPEGDEVAPETLSAPRAGEGDDLKRIKGVGPKLEQMLHEMGFWHYDQIAGWGPAEVAWVDRNLTGFRGRVSRDDWVAQAKLLADGGSTEFSDRVAKGGVYDETPR
jgi:predicted flap endonuclease-1-like 5' DNA nuclease